MQTNNSGAAHAVAPGERTRGGLIQPKAATPPKTSNIQAMIDWELDQLDTDFFWKSDDGWVNAPDPGETPMIVPGLIPQGVGMGLAAMGKMGKTVMMADLFGKMAWPMPGDTWLGRPLPEKGGRVVFVTREEDRPRMTRLANMLGWPERKKFHEENNGDELRFMLRSQLKTSALVLSDGRKVSPTKYMLKLQKFACEFEPVLSFFDTHSKLFMIDQNSRVETSVASDILCDYAAVSGSTAISSLHINNKSEIKSLDQLRREISGSGAAVDGVRMMLGMGFAGRELAQAAIDAGLATEHKQVYIFGGWGNIPELDYLSQKPLILRRGATMRDGYIDITDQLRAANPFIDLLVDGIKVPTSKSADGTAPAKRGRGRPTKAEVAARTAPPAAAPSDDCPF